MYACGEPSTGKIGLSNFGKPEKPMQIAHLVNYKTVMVAAGDAHTI
ncbi:RCC1-like domain-containing protein [Legionella parisiensis]